MITPRDVVTITCEERWLLGLHIGDTLVLAEAPSTGRVCLHGAESSGVGVVGSLLSERGGGFILNHFSQAVRPDSPPGRRWGGATP